MASDEIYEVSCPHCSFEFLVDPGRERATCPRCLNNMRLVEERTAPKAQERLERMGCPECGGALLVGEDELEGDCPHCGSRLEFVPEEALRKRRAAPGRPGTEPPALQRVSGKAPPGKTREDTATKPTPQRPSGPARREPTRPLEEPGRADPPRPMPSVKGKARQDRARRRGTKPPATPAPRAPPVAGPPKPPRPRKRPLRVEVTLPPKKEVRRKKAPLRPAAPPQEPSPQRRAAHEEPLRADVEIEPTPSRRAAPIVAPEPAEPRRETPSPSGGPGAVEPEPPAAAPAEPERTPPVRAEPARLAPATSFPLLAPDATIGADAAPLVATRALAPTAPPERAPEAIVEPAPGSEDAPGPEAVLGAEAAPEAPPEPVHPSRGPEPPETTFTLVEQEIVATPLDPVLTPSGMRDVAEVSSPVFPLECPSCNEEIRVSEELVRGECYLCGALLDFEDVYEDSEEGLDGEGLGPRKPGPPADGKTEIPVPGTGQPQDEEAELEPLVAEHAPEPQASEEPPQLVPLKDTRQPEPEGPVFAYEEELLVEGPGGREAKEPATEAPGPPAAVGTFSPTTIEEQPDTPPSAATYPHLVLSPASIVGRGEAPLVEVAVAAPEAAEAATAKARAPEPPAAVEPEALPAARPPMAAPTAPEPVVAEAVALEEVAVAREAKQELALEGYVPPPAKGAETVQCPECSSDVLVHPKARETRCVACGAFLALEPAEGADAMAAPKRERGAILGRLRKVKPELAPAEATEVEELPPQLDLAEVEPAPAVVKASRPAVLPVPRQRVAPRGAEPAEDAGAGPPLAAKPPGKALLATREETVEAAPEAPVAVEPRSEALLSTREETVEAASVPEPSAHGAEATLAIDDASASPVIDVAPVGVLKEETAAGAGEGPGPARLALEVADELVVEAEPREPAEGKPLVVEEAPVLLWEEEAPAGEVLSSESGREEERDAPSAFEPAPEREQPEPAAAGSLEAEEPAALGEEPRGEGDATPPAPEREALAETDRAPLSIEVEETVEAEVEEPDWTDFIVQEEPPAASNGKSHEEPKGLGVLGRFRRRRRAEHEEQSDAGASEDGKDAGEASGTSEQREGSEAIGEPGVEPQEEREPESARARASEPEPKAGELEPAAEAAAPKRRLGFLARRRHEGTEEDDAVEAAPSEKWPSEGSAPPSREAEAPLVEPEADLHAPAATQASEEEGGGEDAAQAPEPEEAPASRRRFGLFRRKAARKQPEADGEPSMEEPSPMAPPGAPDVTSQPDAAAEPEEPEAPVAEATQGPEPAVTRVPTGPEASPDLEDREAGGPRRRRFGLFGRGRARKPDATGEDEQRDAGGLAAEGDAAAEGLAPGPERIETAEPDEGTAPPGTPAVQPSVEPEPRQREAEGPPRRRFGLFGRRRNVRDPSEAEEDPALREAPAESLPGEAPGPHIAPASPEDEEGGRERHRAEEPPAPQEPEVPAVAPEPREPDENVEEDAEREPDPPGSEPAPEPRLEALQPEPPEPLPQPYPPHPWPQPEPEPEPQPEPEPDDDEEEMPPAKAAPSEPGPLATRTPDDGTLDGLLSRRSLSVDVEVESMTQGREAAARLEDTVDSIIRRHQRGLIQDRPVEPSSAPRRAPVVADEWESLVAATERSGRPVRRAPVDRIITRDGVLFLRADFSHVKGIGRKYAEALHAKGIDTFKEFLAATPERLSEVAGISPEQAKRYQQGADLTRVKGVGERTADLLRAVGVWTLWDLAETNADTTAQKLNLLRKEYQMAGPDAQPAKVREWARHAKRLAH